ncbi:iron complex transport system ATP-binding protein [Pseudobutyrivibrio sp. C4]|uniref:ABC transporter ATP-binding protein n=1 Tax=Pseudobutyrivibrio sp. C4 TaxID=1520803 RepID=UPI0008BF8F5E|nr:ABC transporter ATP-binding protein [Pseudobutyrivibrio sp. C4]SES63204.1 iron complex transport system ATP-binding protein [Pseudobutyrivibrio sp. C4]
MEHNTLKANKIKVGYGNGNILNDVSIHIPENKISVILGSNGSGKSTLLKTFCRLLIPNSGSVTLNDTSLLGIKTKDIAKTIGLLPQSLIAPEGIKVAELVSRGRYPHRKFMAPLTCQDYEAIDEAMAAMKITELADRTVDELSGGQRQRVFIALALAQQTDILFLDEPTTYLDIAYQIEILDLLKELNRTKKTTIVMVLHDINLSSKYADYIFAMKNGKLLAEGTPNEIITTDSVKQIYGIDSVVIEDPMSLSPFVIPISAHDNLQRS